MTFDVYASEKVKKLKFFGFYSYQKKEENKEKEKFIRMPLEQKDESNSIQFDIKN